MCGDDIPGGLDTPEAYADFAAACQAQGYPAFKMHTWMAPLGPDLERDIEACRAVRERVGPAMRLMLDPHHNYTREEALRLGRALEALDFSWMEEPMNEHSTSSYVWLTEKLDLPIVGPETAHGQMYTRAEWIVRGASDISRVGVWDVGGITPAMKVVHLCESFRVRCEVHGGGAANLQVLGAMGIPGEYYERGLLHPHVDFDAESPWLNGSSSGSTPFPIGRDHPDVGAARFVISRASMRNRCIGHPWSPHTNPSVGEGQGGTLAHNLFDGSCRRVPSRGTATDTTSSRA
jgi:hypothetical protein